MDVPRQTTINCSLLFNEMSHVSFTHPTTRVWHSCILVIDEFSILIVRPNKKRFNSRDSLPSSE